ncbi:MAG: hypothetical protein AB1798_24500, partial [Spirochaetota bacterium]
MVVRQGSKYAETMDDLNELKRQEVERKIYNNRREAQKLSKKASELTEKLSNETDLITKQELEIELEAQKSSLQKLQSEYAELTMRRILRDPYDDETLKEILEANKPSPLPPRPDGSPPDGPYVDEESWLVVPGGNNELRKYNILPPRGSKETEGSGFKVSPGQYDIKSGGEYTFREIDREIRIKPDGSVELSDPGQPNDSPLPETLPFQQPSESPSRPYPSQPSPPRPGQTPPDAQLPGEAQQSPTSTQIPKTPPTPDPTATQEIPEGHPRPGETVQRVKLVEEPKPEEAAEIFLSQQPPDPNIYRYQTGGGFSKAGGYLLDRLATGAEYMEKEIRSLPDTITETAKKMYDSLFSPTGPNSPEQVTEMSGIPGLSLELQAGGGLVYDKKTSKKEKSQTQVTESYNQALENYKEAENVYKKAANDYFNGKSNEQAWTEAKDKFQKVADEYRDASQKYDANTKATDAYNRGDITAEQAISMQDRIAKGELTP